MHKRALYQKLFLFTWLSIGHTVMYAMQPHAITNYQNNNLTIHITDKSHPYSPVAEKPILNKKTFPCSLCKEQFASPTGVAIHAARIHTQKRFPCIRCSKFFFDKISLNTHISSHEKIAPICNTCNKAFRYLRNYQKHICPESFIKNSALFLTQHPMHAIVENNYIPLSIQTNNYSMSLEFFPLEALPFESAIENNKFTFY